MEKWIIFLFLSLCTYGIASPSLVFVHLGGAVPSCIFTIIKQARALNPECPLYLLTDSNAYRSLYECKQEFFLEQQVLLINGDQLPQTQQHKEFKKLIQVDFSVSDAYLFYTLQRFFYLFDFIKDRKLQEVIHLENDTMLYVDIEELMPFFKQAQIQLATPFLSKVAAVPCFVFIKDERSLSYYIDHVIDASKSYRGPKPYVGISDMKTLASFYKEFGDSYITPLPTLMSAYSRYHPKRKSHFAQDNATPLDFLSQKEEFFPGFIFDAAALGVFANGNDRKNVPNKNGPGTIHFRSLFDPHYFSFFWRQDLPYLSFKEQEYRIINMHVHSKNAEGLTSYDPTHRHFP